MKTLNNIVKLLIILLIIWTIESCSKGDTADPGSGDDNPPAACDLTNVTFSSTVMPIISANCTSCHSGTGAGANAGIFLTNYTTVSAQASISIGSPGSLLGAITHAAGNTAMPYELAKLSDCNIAKITTWINAGMPNN